jgi:iron complex transport system ATP-binding protein
MKVAANNLTVGYGTSKQVFANLSFTLNDGDVVALLGVNGIGKSTLIRTLSGLLSPISGELLINGQSINQLSVQERAKYISIVLTDRIAIEHIKVFDFIALGRAPHTGWLGTLQENDLALIRQNIALLRIENLQAKWLNELSDGERQKVMIARALCQQTGFIILDEPTAFLDFRSKAEILQLLKNVAKTLNKIILFSTHDIDLALQHANTVWVMKEQKEFYMAHGDAMRQLVNEKLLH